MIVNIYIHKFIDVYTMMFLSCIKQYMWHFDVLYPWGMHRMKFWWVQTESDKFKKLLSIEQGVLAEDT